MPYCFGYRSIPRGIEVECFETRQKAAAEYERCKSTVGPQVEVTAPLYYETREEAHIKISKLLGVHS